MNKTQFIAEVAKKTEKTQKETGVILDAILETIQEKLADGGQVRFQGFGAFETRDRAARKGHNPQTGQPIDIPETTVPAFKPGKGLRDAVKGG